MLRVEMKWWGSYDQEYLCWWTEAICSKKIRFPEKLYENWLRDLDHWFQDGSEGNRVTRIKFPASFWSHISVFIHLLCVHCIVLLFNFFYYYSTVWSFSLHRVYLYHRLTRPSWKRQFHFLNLIDFSTSMFLDRNIANISVIVFCICLVRSNVACSKFVGKFCGKILEAGCTMRLAQSAEGFSVQYGSK